MLPTMPKNDLRDAPTAHSIFSTQGNPTARLVVGYVFLADTPDLLRHEFGVPVMLALGALATTAPRHHAGAPPTENDNASRLHRGVALRKVFLECLARSRRTLSAARCSLQQ